VGDDVRLPSAGCTCRARDKKHHGVVLRRFALRNSRWQPDLGRGGLLVGQQDDIGIRQSASAGSAETPEEHGVARGIEQWIDPLGFVFGDAYSRAYVFPPALVGGRAGQPG